jgi:hypothetical protein
MTSVSLCHGDRKRIDDRGKITNSILYLLSLRYPWAYPSEYRITFKWRRLLGKAMSSRVRKISIKDRK